MTRTGADPGVLLHAGPLEALFLPSQGMLGASLRHEGTEMLGRVADLAAMAEAGYACGIPLLYPWANRLSENAFELAGRAMALRSPLLSRDDNGLSNHGVPWSRLVWTVLEREPAAVRAELRWVQPHLLEVFPFEHRVELGAALDAGGLTISTTVHADAGSPVPISFGFHPYFVLPGVPREQWGAKFPAMQQVLSDGFGIPTGEISDAAALDGAMGSRTYDDGYRLAEPDASFAIAGGGRRITVRFGQGYSHAQLYAPPEADFISIEPMTAPVNALITGEGLGILEAGGTFEAQFRIEVA